MYVHILFSLVKATLREKSAYIYLEQRKFVLILQPKRIFLCNKENYIWFKCLLLYFKDLLLKSKDHVL